MGKPLANQQHAISLEREKERDQKNRSSRAPKRNRKINTPNNNWNPNKQNKPLKC